MKHILCICLSTTLQRTITFENINLAHVNRSEYYRMDASGKAVNSARVLNQLENGCALTICPLGEENKDIFEKLAGRDNLNLMSVTIPGRTRECWTLLDKTAGTTTELVVSEPKLIRDEKGTSENKLLKLIADSLPEVDAVLLAGSRPDFWNEDLYAAIAGISKDNKKLFLADYIGRDLVMTIETAIPDIIKINDEEYCKTFGLKFPAKENELKSDIIEKSRKWRNIIVITRGSDSTLAADCGDFFEYPAEKVKTVNTTACGDSFNAGFLYDYLSSGDLSSALKKGTWCAARNAEVETPGSLF